MNKTFHANFAQNAWETLPKYAFWVLSARFIAVCYKWNTCYEMSLLELKLHQPTGKSSADDGNGFVG